MRVHTYKRKKMVTQMPQWFKFKAWAWHWYMLLVLVSRTHKCLYSKIWKKSSVSMDNDSHKPLYLIYWTQWLMSTVVSQTSFQSLAESTASMALLISPGSASLQLKAHLDDSTCQAYQSSSSDGAIFSHFASVMETILTLEFQNILCIL